MPISPFAAHLHAWARRRTLDLTPAEQITLRYDLRGHVSAALVGCLSIAIAAIRPDWTATAGFIYFILGPIRTWIGYQHGKAQRKLGLPSA